MLRLAAMFALALCVGCGHNIGDSCSTNVDCDPLGTRFCDISAPGGYCTQDGCDVDTCPGDAVCIRFFTQVLNEACQFGLPFPDNKCSPSERCVCDALGQDGSCPSAHCAPEASERRWCQKSCGGDGDCRPQYRCIATGTNGAEPVPTADMLSGKPAKFCAPSPTGS